MITADDFGIGVATSAGIIRAHLQGPVSATSAIVVTGDHALKSADLLSAAPRLKVGLHLLMTDAGSPPLVATRASGLVARDGRFFGLKKLWLRALTWKIDAIAAFDEICAQAELFRKLFGRPPAHVDGHHHAHQLPIIRQAMIKAIAAGVLPPITRLTVEPPAFLASISSARFRRLIIDALGRSARSYFHEENLQCNDYYFGTLSSADLKRPFPWANYLPMLPKTGSIEWAVHPGLYDESLIGRDAYIAGRVRELEALVAPPQSIFLDATLLSSYINFLTPAASSPAAGV